MELVRDFETYSKEIEDDQVAAKVFARFAEDEAAHASQLREMLCEEEIRHGHSR